MKPIILCIFDGYGIAADTDDNAVLRAKTPFLHSLPEIYPTTILETHGKAVGLPEYQMGNSEVGHLTIGAGRVLKQSLPRISDDIASGVFFKNPRLQEACRTAEKNNSHIHIIGLLGIGGVHSHQSHLEAVIQACSGECDRPIILHLITDGRDSGTHEGYAYVQNIEKIIAGETNICIGSISGRYYAMDRDKRWDRTEKAYQAISKAGDITFQSASQYLTSQYEKNSTDEFIPPISFDTFSGLHEDDICIFVNFRTDRPRQLCHVLSDDLFEPFPVSHKRIHLFGMMRYSQDISFSGVLYEDENITDTLSETLAQHGKTQLHIAETEKYAHVTYFLNGGREEKYTGENWEVIPSPQVARYDLAPEMSAAGITEKVLESIHEESHDVIIMNYANPDMVGHTGNINAVIQALEHLEMCFQSIVEEVLQKNGIIFFTADHGNAEDMQNPDGSPQTAHTINPVYFTAISNYTITLEPSGTLADIAPTILHLSQCSIPESMTGRILVKE